MVRLNRSLLVAVLAVPTATLALPKPIDALVASRNAVPKTYSNVFLDRYEEAEKKDKREAEAEAEDKASYGGVFLNRYEETAEKGKRGAEPEAADKATYGGVFLNRYEESPQKE